MAALGGLCMSGQWCQPLVAGLRRPGPASARSVAAAARGPDVPCTSDCRWLLGVGRNATPAEVKAAFLAAAWRHHPDTAGAAHDGMAFARLRTCYELLLRHAQEGERSQLSSEAHPHRDGADSTRRPPGALRPCTWQAARAAGSLAHVEDEAPPIGLEVRLPAFDRGTALDFCGGYRRTHDFNASPAYVHCCRSYYVFWSQLFGDWKIGERLAEKGLCLAFADGGRGEPPWAPALPGPAGRPAVLQWSVWDPSERRFTRRLLTVLPTLG